MKKVITGIVCFVLLLCFAINVFAEDNNLETYTNESSYEINIPTTLNIGKNKAGYVDIIISDVNVAANEVVVVSVFSDNYKDGIWYMLNVNNSEDKVSYNIGSLGGMNDVKSGDEFISTNADTYKTLFFSITGEDKIGTFMDVLTFTSEIKTNN